MRIRLRRLRLNQFVTSRHSSTTTYQDTTALKQALLNRTFPLEYDDLTNWAQVLLHSSLSDFLPPAPNYHKPTNFLHPGSHLLLFRPVIPERDLLPDGTDIQHAPDRSYKYRLWAGGEFVLHQGRPILLHHLTSIMLRQRIMEVNARTNSDASKPPKFWVNIHRDIHWPDDSPDRRSGQQDGQRRGSTLLLSEKRWLVFSQQRPDLALDKVTDPPKNSFYSVSMKPTNALLFRFSALTFNAHAVHLDPEYTRNEYGLPGLLVHGPLTLVLMMEVLARGFHQYAQQNRLNPQRYLVRKVQYRNIAPIFAGEEVTICCKPQPEIAAEASEATRRSYNAAIQSIFRFPATAPAPPTNSPAPKLWDVWIQKSIHGQPSVCVKGTVTFGKVGDVEPNDSYRWKAASRGFVFGSPLGRRQAARGENIRFVKSKEYVARDIRTV